VSSVSIPSDERHPNYMNAILLQLTKPAQKTGREYESWQRAASDLANFSSKADNSMCDREGRLVILDADASDVLGRSIASAATCGVSYKITFFEKASEWNYEAKVALAPR
jgi:hypothetical protein